MTTTPESTLSFPPKFRPLFAKYRYKTFFGGRGSGKSWSVAQYLVYRALESNVRILCAREFQSSIRDSVHRLISDVIYNHGLQAYFTIEHASIRCNTGAEFIFFGLFRNIEAIKSTEGIDICWCEEAERISTESWDILKPTIRKPNSEIIITYNPQFDSDPTHQMFVLSKPPPPNSVAVEVNWQDNPHFPEVLRDEMEWCRVNNPAKYLHIWEGKTRAYSDALIFRKKVVIEHFVPIDPTAGERHMYGADWGFANDPTVLLRGFIRNVTENGLKHKDLHIDAEAYQVGVEITDLPRLFLTIPECRHALIYADNARPETISFMKAQGFYIQAADKWNGSVEDGIEFIRGFRRIVIHPNCPNAQYEFTSYAYKTDRMTNAILPTPLELNDHCPDATRYMLSAFIKNRVSILNVL